MEQRDGPAQGEHVGDEQVDDEGLEAGKVVVSMKTSDRSVKRSRRRSNRRSSISSFTQRGARSPSAAGSSSSPSQARTR